MHWFLLLHTLLQFMAALAACTLARSAWRHRSTNPGLKTLTFLLVTAAEWTVASALQLTATTLSAMLLWQNLQLIGAAAMPTLWLLFVIEWRAHRPLSSRWRYLLAVEPLLAILLAWTNGSHHVFWLEHRVINAGGLSLLQNAYGPAFIAHSAYAFLLMLASSILLFRLAQGTFGLFRMQAAALLGVGLFAWAAQFLTLTSSADGHMVMLSVAFLFGSIAVVWVLFRLHLLGIAPVARNLVIESMSDGLIVLDATGRIVDANPVAAQILNRPIAALLGQPAVRFFSTGASLDRNDDQPTHLRPQITWEGPGDRRIFEARISDLTDESEQRQGSLILLHDITEHIAAETALRQAKEAAEIANRTKSEFLDNMSHELRTPLNSIIGYTDLILMGIYGELTPVQRDRLDKIAANGRHLLQLIVDIMDISRIEAEHISLNMEQVDVAVVIDNCITLLQPRAADQGLTILRDIPTAPPPVTADARRVQQVIFNLIDNAIKFTPEGAVAVHAALVPRDVVPQLPIPPESDISDWVMLAIEDTGIGVAPEHQALIFEDFRQVDGSTTRQYQGVGLGLTIAQRLVTLMHGHIWVESKCGQGTTFYVLLPVIAPGPIRESLAGQEPEAQPDGISLEPAPNFRSQSAEPAPA